MYFQATGSKGNKKLTLLISAASIEEARTSLHKQGYSIMELHPAENIESQDGNFFYFDVKVGENIKTGKIQSDDIFKAYRKLIEDLNYNIIYIYPNQNNTKEEKEKITINVKDGYDLYLEYSGVKKEEDLSNKGTILDREVTAFSPQVLNEIKKYENAINDTILKIQNLISKYFYSISDVQKSQLEELEGDLARLKGTKNLGKIQVDLEDALRQIGNVELELLKKASLKDRDNFLKETNKLLKQIGSTDYIQTEKERKNSIGYQVQQIIEKTKVFLIKYFGQKKIFAKKVGIDEKSFIFLKNKRELIIYKKSFSKNTMDIARKIIFFQWNDLNRLILKRRLIYQNIQIIDSRIHNQTITYSKISYGFRYYLKMFFILIRTISGIFTMALFLFVLTYIGLNFLRDIGYTQYYFINKSILYITLFSLFTFFSLFTQTEKRVIQLLVLTIIYIILFIFLSVNF